MKNDTRTYIKTSSIPNAGNGLYANIPIKKGDRILRLKGVVRKPGQRCKSSRSNIYFNDGYILECSPTDQASFANDPINIPDRRRRLIKALKSDEPFYAIQENTSVNVVIEIKNKKHRAFLIAQQYIQKDEEIFRHYWFSYWFARELHRGFPQEDEIDEHGFPETFHQYPAFINYLKLVYPDCTHITANVSKNSSEVLVHRGIFVVHIPIPNYRKLLLRDRLESLLSLL